MKPYHNIVIINGPNLNLLGKRETDIYGDESFESYFEKLKNEFPTLNLAFEQSNSEGTIIDLLQEYGFNSWGIVLNAAGYTHTSIAIADTVTAIPTQVVEVHISDINKREDFRKHSYLTAVSDYHVIGKGLAGYEEAVRFLADLKE